MWIRDAIRNMYAQDYRYSMDNERKERPVTGSRMAVCGLM
jgi:hypothetical protein